jgi:hypothetical protein
MDRKRLGMVMAALYNPAAGRTTAALAEALERLAAPDHEGDLWFVVPSAVLIPHAVGYGRSLAAHLGIGVVGDRKDGLILAGDPPRRLRVVSVQRFINGTEVRGRPWGGRRKSPDFVADPGVLEMLWKLRRKKS